MVDGLSTERWALLRQDRPNGEDALTTMPVRHAGGETHLLLAIDQPGNLHLLIPVNSVPRDTPPADLNGLRVRRRELEIGLVLDLSAPPSHEPVFTPFCQAIIKAIVEDERDPFKAVAATIRAWQSAWKPIRQDMEKTVQVGVFGELLVLRTLLIPCLGPSAVGRWSGPDSERHDFLCGDLHVEVKTTRKGRPEHEISRIDQLRVPEGRQLFVVSVQVEQSATGEHSVVTEVDAVVDLLRSDAAALDDFMTKMISLGWSDELRHSGELLRFHIRSAEVYAVDEAFPRLPDDFIPPTGVVSVKYTIDLANLPTRDVGEVQELIRRVTA